MNDDRMNESSSIIIYGRIRIIMRFVEVFHQLNDVTIKSLVIMHHTGLLLRTLL